MPEILARLTHRKFPCKGQLKLLWQRADAVARTILPSYLGRTRSDA
jgi:hypothetical protein